MNKIPVVLCSDDNIFFAIDALLFLLSLNARPDNFYEVNILCAGAVSEENKSKVKEMEKIFLNLSITLFDMKDRFKNIKKNL